MANGKESAGAAKTTENTRPWKIVLIGTFAEDYLVEIAHEVVKNAATGTTERESYVADIGEAILVWKRGEEGFKEAPSQGAKCLFEKIESENGEKTSRWDKYYRILPLFVCEWMSDFHKCGLKCPYEFAIERKDLLSAEGLGAVKLLRQRIDILQTQEQSRGGVRLATFKDWMSGVMRKYLFLDDTAHGISGYIDPKDPNWSWKKWFAEKDFETWRNRFIKGGKSAANDPLGYLRPLMEKLWHRYFGDDEQFSLATLPERINADTEKRLDAIYNVGKSREDVDPKMRLPLSQGDRARFVTPTGKINILLIDDDASKSILLDPKSYREVNKTSSNVDVNNQESNTSQSGDWVTLARKLECDKLDPNKRTDYEDSWRLFDKIFSVQPLTLTPKDFPKLEGWLQEILRSRLSYNFALVDLCFGEDAGNDPLGYHVIKKLSKLFPHMPIVVYSRYKDMGHIMRAFQCGAMWFLQKGEEQKLARHLMDVVKKGSWKREWRAMQDYNPVEFIYNGRDQAFDDRFRNTPSWQYLTAKCLEYFPGKFIEVKKMGGGISTASTFSVQKGLKIDGNPLQSPMIIKIDTAPNTRMEYERYFRYIRPYMANEAGRIEKPGVIVDRKRSAIVYTFAGRQDAAHALDSMKNMLKNDIVFKASCDYEKYRKAFDMIFDEILPKIHRVTPNREFGDGEENRHQEVFSKPEALDAKKSKGASFPNLQFGEVANEDFYQTYLIRYPHFGKRELANNAFDEQPKFRITEDKVTKETAIDLDKSKSHPYEFHDVWENDDGSIDLEVYDCLADRKPYLLTGPIATHVAKFRQQMHPGSILWVRGAVDCVGTGEMCECMFVERVEEDGKWIKYANKYSEDDASKSKCSGAEYFDLVNKVLRFCKALFDSENKDADRRLDDAEYEKYLGGARLFDVKEAKEFFAHLKGRFKCPIAICHGDLNYGNIMLESRKHPPKDEKPDVSQTITDAWLIDFARTRRDMIAHDFNVMFTDSFALLFDERLFNKSKTPSGNGGSQKDQKEDIVKETWDIEKARYERRLDSRMRRFIEDVMFAENSNPPDYLNGDARFEFVYKILRRIRKAALDAGISIEMYTLTTVLECLMALKLHLKKGMKNIRASAALFAVAKICFEHLCEDVELDLLKTQR